MIQSPIIDSWSSLKTISTNACSGANKRKPQNNPKERKESMFYSCFGHTIPSNSVFHLRATLALALVLYSCSSCMGLFRPMQGVTTEIVIEGLLLLIFCLLRLGNGGGALENTRQGWRVCRNGAKASRITCYCMMGIHRFEARVPRPDLARNHTHSPWLVVMLWRASNP